MAHGRLALLRGINVGGRNIVSMADLRAAFDDEGFAGVRTYIQSGNVVFSDQRPTPQLEADVEAMLDRRLGVPVMVVALTAQDLRRVVDEAPPGFGEEPDDFKYDVMFLKHPMTAAEVMDVLDPREGVDAAWPGIGVVYFSRRSDSLTRSRMSKVASTEAYARMTVRNWRTTTKLLQMLEEG